jgi:two-component system, OmpR family, response regulator
MSAGTKQKILFVDDEAHWREMASTALAEAGFDVLAASDGSEAIQQAADARLGLMIVDEDLAGESGEMLTRFLRRNHPGVPTLLYTNHRHDSHQSPDRLHHGPDRCLHKGSMTDLLANVAYHVR